MKPLIFFLSFVALASCGLLPPTSPTQATKRALSLELNPQAQQASFFNQRPNEVRVLTHEEKINLARQGINLPLPNFGDQRAPIRFTAENNYAPPRLNIIQQNDLGIAEETQTEETFRLNLFDPNESQKKDSSTHFTVPEVQQQGNAQQIQQQIFSTQQPVPQQQVTFQPQLGVVNLPREQLGLLENLPKVNLQQFDLSKLQQQSQISVQPSRLPQAQLQQLQQSSAQLQQLFSRPHFRPIEINLPPLFVQPTQQQVQSGNLPSSQQTFLNLEQQRLPPQQQFFVQQQQQQQQRPLNIQPQPIDIPRPAQPALTNFQNVQSTVAPSQQLNLPVQQISLPPQQVTPPPLPSPINLPQQQLPQLPQLNLPPQQVSSISPQINLPQQQLPQLPQLNLPPQPSPSPIPPQINLPPQQLPQLPQLSLPQLSLPPQQINVQPTQLPQLQVTSFEPITPALNIPSPTPIPAIQQQQISIQQPINIQAIPANELPSQQVHVDVNQQQEPIVQKHVYFHVPPQDLEEQEQTLEVRQEPPKKRIHYRIIFIKAPSPPRFRPKLIAPVQQQQEKTVVYVLVKKPETPRVILPAPTPSPVTKPEVFFIRYGAKSTGNGLVQEIVKKVENVEVETEPVVGESIKSTSLSSSTAAPVYGPPGYQKRDT